ncbi:MAG: 3-deoxy-D-manno-octulosonic acid transferase [Flavobacteriaceae bacterium]|nr:3-deoxy-D-manno-octulosonic acid transferase [Flavobacteriaceae bacterium]
MRFLYSTLTTVFEKVLPVSGLFSAKMKLFINGRKTVFQTLKSQLSDSDKAIWFHCASLGEYEQGLPVMEAVKKRYPKHKLVVSFFSPSGYENKRNNSIGDVTVYLPLDTKGNVKRFLNLIKPEIAVFVKYEFWPNYLLELHKRKIPTLLISALFRKKQVFFKPHGFWLRTVLKSFTHIFVQDEKSKQLLESISIKQVTVSGDTRYDRVSKQIEEDNNLDFIELFIGNSLCIVAGSTWPEDEEILIDYINQSPKNIKFIIAPHNLKKDQIDTFEKRLIKKTVRFSEMGGKHLSDFNVFILDTIGLLKKVYSYADVAYVGGGMGTTGLHNILEAATFGVPVVIGKNFDDFPEAKALQSRAGLFSVTTKNELETILDKLIENTRFREKTGMINGHFVQNNTGATNTILNYLTNFVNN